MEITFPYWQISPPAQNTIITYIQYALKYIKIVINLYGFTSWGARNRVTATLYTGLHKSSTKIHELHHPMY